MNIKKVEEALYRKCLGYTVPVKKLVKCKRTEYDERGHKTSEQEQLVEGEEETFVAPSVSAQMFFLKNRDPDRWGSGAAVFAGEDLELEEIEET